MLIIGIVGIVGIIVMIVIIAVIDAPRCMAPDLTGVAEVQTPVQTDGAIHLQIPHTDDGQHLFTGPINAVHTPPVGAKVRRMVCLTRPAIGYEDCLSPALARPINPPSD